MRELPITMDSDSIRAILAGRKTQTRRVMKPFPDVQCIKLHRHGDEWLESWSEHRIPCYRSNAWMRHKSPYRRGDLLWVKESWRPWSEDDCGCISDYNECFCNKGVLYAVDWRCDSDIGPWKSPVSMLKKDARIWLRVTKVRAERLQDIDAAGIIGEGVFEEIEDDPDYDKRKTEMKVFDHC